MTEGKKWQEKERQRRRTTSKKEMTDGGKWQEEMKEEKKWQTGRNKKGEENRKKVYKK